jgi:hypothetical protein
MGGERYTADGKAHQQSVGPELHGLDEDSGSDPLKTTTNPEGEA